MGNKRKHTENNSNELHIESFKMVDHDMSVGHAHLTNFLNLFQA